MKEHQLQNVAFLLQNLLKSFGKYFPSEYLDLVKITINESGYNPSFNAKFKNEFINCEIWFCIKDECLRIIHLSIRNYKHFVNIGYLNGTITITFFGNIKSGGFNIDLEPIEYEVINDFDSIIKECILMTDNLVAVKTFKDVNQILSKSRFKTQAIYNFSINHFSITLYS